MSILKVDRDYADGAAKKSLLDTIASLNPKAHLAG